MSAASANDRLALLGGSPVRPEGFPSGPEADPDILASVHEALRTGAWARYHGPGCERLADLMAHDLRSQHVLLCCSGTAAIELALRGCGIGPGDEVLLAAYDFKGNFQDVLAVGAVPVLVDPGADDWQLRVEHLDQACSSNTKAVLASHLHGGAVDMPRLMEWARARKLWVIEDACQTPAASLFDRPAGTWGDVGVVSFGGSKLLSAGRGGALFTNRPEIAQRVRIFTQRGNDAYPLSELQAAVLIPQWLRLPTQRAVRHSAADALRPLLRGSVLEPFVDREPERGPMADFYKLGLRYQPERLPGVSREVCCRALRAEGIPIDLGFRALHATHASRRFRSPTPLPVATVADATSVVLHHSWLSLGPDGARTFVAALDKVTAAATELAHLPPCD